MSRLLRMLLLCTVAAVLSAHLPVNFVVVMIAVLALEEGDVAAFVVVAFAAISQDSLMGLPLGLSILPFAVMTFLIRLLKSKIYLHALASRLVWVMVAVLSFYAVMGIQLMIRTGLSLYLWDGVFWGVLHSLAEGLLAAILSPYVHRFLGVTLEELRITHDIIQ